MYARRRGTSRGSIPRVCCSPATGLGTTANHSLGWGKKLSYCIAFSADGAQDVTRRYVRDAKHAADRKRAPESVLLYIMDEIRATRRANLSKQDKFRLQGEDAREQKELRSHIVAAIAHEVSKLNPQDIINAQSPPRRQGTDGEKALEGRMSGNTQWIQGRGESGRSQSNQQHDPRSQQPR